MDSRKMASVPAPSEQDASARWEALDRAQAIAEFALDGTILHANNHFLNALGYSLEEIAGRHHRMLCETAHVGKLEYRRFWETLARGECVQGEHKRITKDGREIWLFGSYIPVLDESDCPCRVVALVSDVSAAKSAAVETQGKVDAIHRAQAVISFALDGTILDANPNFLDVMGYALDEIKGKHHRIFCDPDYARSRAYKDFWAELAAGEFSQGEFRRVGKGGRDVWIQATYNPIFDASGKPCQVVKFASDVTAAKLRSAENEGKLAALDKSQAVVEFSLDGHVIAANDNFLRMFGYALPEVQGRHHRMFCGGDLAQSAAYFAFWEKLGRGEFDQGEYKRVGKGGRELWVQATYNPIFDAAGKPFKVVAFASDVTEAKQRNAEFQGKVDAIAKSQAVIEFMLDGTVLTANANFLRAMGYGLDEIQGRHHRMFCDPAYADSGEYEAFWAKLAKGEFVAGEFKRHGKNGREVWINASYNPILDTNGRPCKVVKFATDVSRAKARNADFEGKLSGISRAQAVIEFAVDGTVLAANDNFLRTMGYSFEEIRGKHHRTFCEEAYAKSPAYRDFWENLNRGEPESGRFRRVGKAGKVVWIQANYTPILDLNGRVCKVVKFATDVTAQVEAQSSLEQAISRLAEDFTRSSQSIAETSAHVARGTQALEGTAEAMGVSVADLTRSIQAIVANTRNADALAHETQSSGQEGATLVGKSVESMALINKSSEEIAAIVQTIGDIAGQTNLLAFNAAIEAARAGEHGLGFSIVADEVRKLAEKSSIATKDIAKLIAESSQRVANGSQIAKDAGDSFARILKGVAKTTQAISEIAALAEEQQEAARKVGEAIQHVVQETEKAAQACGSIAQATQQLEVGARALNETIAKAAAVA